MRSVALVAIIICSVSAVQNILNFGAIPFKTDLGTEFGNAAAFYKAVMFAHNHKTDKHLLIPANYTFNIVPA